MENVRFLYNAGAQDDEMVFTVPIKKPEDLILGLEQLGISTISTHFSLIVGVQII